MSSKLACTVCNVPTCLLNRSARVAYCSAENLLKSESSELDARRFWSLKEHANHPHTQTHTHTHTSSSNKDAYYECIAHICKRGSNRNVCVCVCAKSSSGPRSHFCLQLSEPPHVAWWHRVSSKRGKDARSGGRHWRVGSRAPDNFGACGSFRTARPTPTPTPARPLRPRLQGITPCTFSPFTHRRTPFPVPPHVPAALMSDCPAPYGACLMLAPGRASGLRPRHRCGPRISPVDPPPHCPVCARVPVRGSASHCGGAVPALSV